MNKISGILFAALSITAVQPALAEVSQTPVQTTGVAVSLGQILYTAAGKTIAPVYRITATGEPQVMVDERLVTVPGSTLSMSGTKLETKLSIPELRRLGH